MCDFCWWKNVWIFFIKDLEFCKVQRPSQEGAEAWMLRLPYTTGITTFGFQLSCYRRINKVSTESFPRSSTYKDAAVESLFQRIQDAAVEVGSLKPCFRNQHLSRLLCWYPSDVRNSTIRLNHEIAAPLQPGTSFFNLRQLMAPRSSTFNQISRWSGNCR